MPHQKHAEVKQAQKVSKKARKLEKKQQKIDQRTAKKIRKAEDETRERAAKIKKDLAKKQAKAEYRRLPKKEKKQVKAALKKQKKAARAKRKQIRHAKQPVWEPAYSNRISPNELVNMESLWGGILFGPIPAGHQRNFFEYKKNVWIWYEGWPGKKGNIEGTTIRYEVRPAGVFKRVNGQKYEKIAGQELDYFRMTLHRYLKLMKTKLYY